MSKPSLNVEDPLPRTKRILLYVITFGFLLLLGTLEVNLSTPLAYGLATTLYYGAASFFLREPSGFVWWKWALASLLAGVAMALFCVLVNFGVGIFWAIRNLTRA